MTSQPNKEDITCLICGDVYQEPYLTRCYHTFCFQCIIKMTANSLIMCPECDDVTMVKDIEKDVKMQKIVERYHKNLHPEYINHNALEKENNYYNTSQIRGQGQINGQGHESQSFTVNMNKSIQELREEIQSVSEQSKITTRNIEDITNCRNKQISEVKKMTFNAVKELKDNERYLVSVISKTNDKIIDQLLIQQEICYKTKLELENKLDCLANHQPGGDTQIFMETIGKQITELLQNINANLPKLACNLKSPVTVKQGENWDAKACIDLILSYDDDVSSKRFEDKMSSAHAREFTCSGKYENVARINKVDELQLNSSPGYNSGSGTVLSTKIIPGNSSSSTQGYTRNCTEGSTLPSVMEEVTTSSGYDESDDFSEDEFEVSLYEAVDSSMKQPSPVDSSMKQFIPVDNSQEPELAPHNNIDKPVDLDKSGLMNGNQNFKKDMHNTNGSAIKANESAESGVLKTDPGNTITPPLSLSNDSRLVDPNKNIEDSSNKTSLAKNNTNIAKNTASTVENTASPVENNKSIAKNNNTKCIVKSESSESGHILRTDAVTSGPVTYTDITKDTYQLHKTEELDYTAFGMCLIDDHIWCAGDRALFIHSLDCTLVQKVSHKKMQGITSLCNMDTGIIAVDTSGLHLLDTSGNYQRKILSGSFSGVNYNNSHLYALEYGSNQLLVLDQSPTNQKWLVVERIQMKYDSDPWDRLFVYQGEVFISSYAKHYVFRLDLNGQCVSRIENPRSKELRYPVLCGADSTGNLLVVGNESGEIRVYDVNNSTWHDVSVTHHVGFPRAAMVTGNGDLWVITYPPKLIKFTRMSNG